MPKIRAAILGYGRSGSTMHAGAIEHNSQDFAMTAVCDIDPERQKQASERFGCPIYDDCREMLAKEDLDLVSVVTRSDQHCQMTCDCLDAGVNVLVTKPWAVNADEARRMISAAEASGKMLLPWLPARWGCVLGRLKELMSENAIGDVFLVRHTVCSFATRNDWQTERRYGGGYLLNWGPHIVDSPIVLMGARVESVYARMKQTINPGDTEDVFLAVMNLANGAVAQAEHTVAVEELPSWFIQGDRGAIVVRGREITIHKKTPPRPADPTDFATMQSSDSETLRETAEGAVYGDENAIYAEVAKAIRGEKEFPVRPEHALELTRVLDAIRLADKENRVVVP
jgi:predicted dehydrogenase